MRWRILLIGCAGFAAGPCLRLGAWGHLRRGRRRRRLGRLLVQEVEYVLLGDAAAAAACRSTAGHRRPPRRHADAPPATAALPRLAGGGASASVCPSSAAAALPSPSSRERGRGGAAAPSSMRPTTWPIFTVCPCFTVMTNRPDDGAGIGRGRLFRFQLEDRLVGADGVAVLLQPLRDGAFGDRLADGGDDNVDGHSASWVQGSGSAPRSAYSIRYLLDRPRVGAVQTLCKCPAVGDIHRALVRGGSGSSGRRSAGRVPRHNAECQGCDGAIVEVIPGDAKVLPKLPNVVRLSRGRNMAYGLHYFGKVDRVRGLCYVTTYFFHLLFIPFIPLGSCLILDRPEDRWTWKKRGLRIPMSGKSVLLGYLRGFCLGTVLISLGILMSYVGNDRPRSDRGEALLYIVGTCGIAAALFTLSLLGGKASPQRAIQLGAYLGIPAETMQKLLVPEDSRLRLLEAYLRAHPDALDGCSRVGGRNKVPDRSNTSIRSNRRVGGAGTDSEASPQRPDTSIRKDLEE